MGEKVEQPSLNAAELGSSTVKPEALYLDSKDFENGSLFGPKHGPSPESSKEPVFVQGMS